MALKKKQRQEIGQLEQPWQMDEDYSTHGEKLGFGASWSFLTAISEHKAQEQVSRKTHVELWTIILLSTTTSLPSG